MKHLIEIRKEKSITQSQVAEFLGISRPTYTNYENDNREPDIDTIKRLANYFDVSIDYLLGKTDKRKSPESEIPESDIKVALFGGDCEVTDKMWEEVKNFVDFVKSKKGDSEDENS